MNELSQYVGNIFSKLVFWGKQHAPEILIGVGITTGAGSTALACVATTKVKNIVEATKQELADIEEIENELEDPKKERAKVILKATGRIAKNYAPAFGLFVVSTSCILYGTGILNKRNAALSVGLAAATSAFKDYRAGVIERYGEEVDKQIRYGLKTVEAKCQETDTDGKTKTVKKKVEVTDKSNHSVEDYIRIFDDSNPYWDSDLDVVKYFINSQQYIYNNKLVADGFVFMNDVLCSLGFPKTKVGQLVGWNYDDKNPMVDNYIDFDVHETKIPVELGDGSVIYKPAFILNFNVDGGILNTVDWPDKD